MIDRREFAKLAGLGVALAALPRAAAAVGMTVTKPVLGEDGLYHQPWFLDSFLTLSDDLAEAKQDGKRFVIMWEQKAVAANFNPKLSLLHGDPLVLIPRLASHRIPLVPVQLR